jgi:hypothetical protein
VCVLGIDPYALSLAELLQSRGHGVALFDIDPVKQAQASASSLATNADIFICSSALSDPTLLQAHLSALRPTAKTLIINEAHVHPGLSEALIVPRIGESQFAYCGAPFETSDIASARRVIGAGDAKSDMAAFSFYKTFVDADLYHEISIKEAEAAVFTTHMLRAVERGALNELAPLFDRVGIDMARVLHAAEILGTAVPRPGVTDEHIEPYFFSRRGDRVPLDSRVLSAAQRATSALPSYVASCLDDALRDKKMHRKGARVLIASLREEDALVRALDRGGFSVRIISRHLQEHDVADTDAVIAVNTEVDPALLSRASVPVIIDATNSLSRSAFVSAGISYRGVGRG